MNPCASCRRHVRATEIACPFCGAALSDDARGHVAPDTTARMKRAALFVFGASIASAGCSSTTVSGDASSTDTVTIDRESSDVQSSDVQSTDVQSTDVQAADTAVDRPDVYDNGGAVPPYGLPPPTDAGVPDDQGSIKADYGAPPPRDGG
ncbi:MAG: hypothetical protein U0325_36285 [Polyangiales bacterium]